MIRNLVKFGSVGLVLLCFLAGVLASAIIIFKERHNLYQKVANLAGVGTDRARKKRHDPQADAVWAKKLLEGGYLLHFRHAERDKWYDLYMYDALESDAHSNGVNGTRFAENDYFADAVCLNGRGKIQARAMGEHIKRIGLPIGHVISSPSCRARQTADLAFGGYAAMDRILVHPGPYAEDENTRVQALKQLYLNLPIEPGRNSIISAHNSVVASGLFANTVGGRELILEEGGFFVISRNDDRLVLQHTFYDFSSFMRNFYKR